MNSTAIIRRPWVVNIILLILRYSNIGADKVSVCLALPTVFNVIPLPVRIGGIPFRKLIIVR